MVILKPQQRFASLTLAYNQQDYIEYCLRSVATECEQMFVMYSEKPFTRYNQAARQEGFSSDKTGEILRQLQKTYPHLYLITGEWDDEEEMRNAGLAVARAIGFKYLLVLDADEFYRNGDLTRIKKFVLDSPAAESWWCKFRVPFKFGNYVIDREDEYLPVVLNIESEVHFVNRRIPNGARFRLPEELVCFNMGFVLSDPRMYEKIRTYSHAHQIPENWFEQKWLKWTPKTQNLHTRVPELWPCTRKFDPRHLPEVLHTHPLIHAIKD